MQLRARWPAVRAGLIAIALGLALADGCPDHRQAPPWARPIADLGDQVRSAVRRPIAGIAADLDISQRWALFRGASRRRFRLYVEVRDRGGAWQLLHRAGDPEHAAYADQLAYRRIRGTYAPSGQLARGQYHPFAAWMVRRVHEDHPDATAIRTRLERVAIGDGSATPLGEFILEHEELVGSP
jgi:hypothetical protein